MICYSGVWMLVCFKSGEAMKAVFDEILHVVVCKPGIV
jgi:hypothetical protein